MCLVIFAYNCHPRYRLVVAANRDEFYERPALPAAFWGDNPDILAGRDLREGGTWMGITRSGRFAVLTNYRDPSRFKPGRKSRGHLVQGFLSSRLEPRAYIDGLGNTPSDYNGFNLLFGASKSLYYYSNQEGSIRQVEPGVHGLSNALLDTPWPKVTRGIEALSGILQNDDIAPEQLFAIMADRTLPDDQALPQTGVGIEMERMLAPAYVTSENYGTRVTSVLLIDNNNEVQFRERSFTPTGSHSSGEVNYQFFINT